VRRQLFREADKGKYFAEFILGGLLRGDAKTRAEYYRVGRNDGWLSANDIRELENMNPIPPEQGGDEYLINANMVPVRATLQEKGGETDAGN
jgi:phage portal protein BeeE